MTKSDEDRRHNAIRDILLDKVKPKISNREFFSAQTFDATTLALEDPFAFLIASCLGRQTESERIWTIPYDLKQRLGALDVAAISQIPERKLDQIARELPNKPRFVNTAAKTILDLSRMIRDKSGGRAENMWQDRSPKQFERDLRSIRGVGPHIASMTSNLVIRLYGDVFSRDDLKMVDIKADIHTRRVLYRLGIAAENSDTAALEAARRLNPPYSRGLDAPLWCTFPDIEGTAGVAPAATTHLGWRVPPSVTVF
ncbi:MAG: endonuclease III domain-containing protein [Bryobacterales bacterium]|nr:endonuclease III domain-containing protein [Bryobacterales bacterium]